MELRLDIFRLVLQEEVQIFYLAISILNSFNSFVEFRLLTLQLTIDPHYLLIFLSDNTLHLLISLFDFTLHIIISLFDLTFYLLIFLFDFTL